MMGLVSSQEKEKKPEFKFSLTLSLSLPLSLAPPLPPSPSASLPSEDSAGGGLLKIRKLVLTGSRVCGTLFLDFLVSARNKCC